MNATLVRSSAAWLVTLAVGAAGVLGCNPASPEARPAAPRDAALEQQTTTANGEAFRQDRRKGPKNAQSAPQLPPGVPAKVATPFSSRQTKSPTAGPVRSTRSFSGRGLSGLCALM